MKDMLNDADVLVVFDSLVNNNKCRAVVIDSPIIRIKRQQQLCVHYLHCLRDKINPVRAMVFHSGKLPFSRQG